MFVAFALVQYGNICHGNKAPLIVSSCLTQLLSFASSLSRFASSLSRVFLVLVVVVVVVAFSFCFFVFIMYHVVLFSLWALFTSGCCLCFGDGCSLTPRKHVRTSLLVRISLRVPIYLLYILQ